MAVKDNSQELIEIHERRLQLLKLRVARQGYSVDPSVLIEIENIEETIETLKKDLERIRISMEVTMKDKIKVLIADDNPIMLDGLQLNLNQYHDIELAGKIKNISNTLTMVLEKKATILIIDLAWNGNKRAGIDQIRQVRKMAPEVKIIAITAYEELIDKAEDAGAHIARRKGFPAKDLVEDIRAMAKLLSIEQDSTAANLTTGILRILNSEGYTIGTGFIIGENLAVTCAHVIQKANSAPGKPVWVEFYADKSRDKGGIETKGYKSPETDDVAFIRLSSLPPNAHPLPLGKVSHKNSGHKYHAFGFAKLYDYGERHVTDETIAGLVQHPDKQPMLQLNGTLIKGGLSGAPVLDVETDKVVGMVSESADDRGDGAHSATRLSWATSANTIIHLLSNI